VAQLTEHAEVEIAPPAPGSLAPPEDEPKPAPPTEPTVPDTRRLEAPADDDEDDDEGETPTKRGRREVRLADGELAGLCGDLYADALTAIAVHRFKLQGVEFPSDRAFKRGRQLAFALRKLDWQDDEILLLVGLGAGVAADLAWLSKVRDEQKAGAAREASS
jgi:hypothetical protein